MSKILSITISDHEYEELRAAGAGSLTPEAVVSMLISDHFGLGHIPEGTQENTHGDVSKDMPLKAASETPQEERDKYRSAREQFRANLRNQGLLVDSQSSPTNPGAKPLPPYGSPEYSRLEDEVTAEAGEAFLRSGLNILDLIERR